MSKEQWFKEFERRLNDAEAHSPTGRLSAGAYQRIGEEVYNRRGEFVPQRTDVDYLEEPTDDEA